MRKISLVLVAAMLLSAGNVLANDSKPKDPSKNLTEQISKMLSKNSFTDTEVDLTAQVRFTLNNEHQVVVLSVDTEDVAFEEFVMAKLNYKMVNLNTYKEGKIYTVPVRIAS